MNVLSQIVQITGSALLLTAYLLSLRGKLATQSSLYLALNGAASTVLALNAGFERQIGFLILEATWAIASITGLVHLLRRMNTKSEGGHAATTAIPLERKAS